MPIHPEAAIGAVHLTIADIDRSIAFYEERLGFTLHRRQPGVAVVGVGGDDLLVLSESPSAPVAPRTTGLYHFAILVPSRLELARSLRRLALRRVPMHGFGDHLVSEAIYLGDPDGNGIEVYRDRPRDEWQYVNGQLRMASDPLDVEGLLREAEADAEINPEWRGLAAGTRIGHVHLRVSFIEDTLEFYERVLGFTLTARYGDSAIFLAAGGYHHHIAANTWAGVGAPRPPRGAIGLDHFVVQLPDQTSVNEVADRANAAGVASERSAGMVRVEDPSGNAVLLKARA
jgi:catechol 2,3-dioxygenase